MTSHVPGRLTATILVALTLAGCAQNNEVDENGRWVGGATTMRAWATTHVPTTWEQTSDRVRYEPIIDDLGKDVGFDYTKLARSYRIVTKEEFQQLSTTTLRHRRPVECEPYDPAVAQPGERPSRETCFIDLYQGEAPLPDDFDLFAAWTDYGGGSTTVDLYLTNDPR